MSKVEIKAQFTVDDAGTLMGVAWPFGSADQVGDIIEPGAFSFPAALPILSEHDQRHVVGVWESVTETEIGLEVKGRLFVEGVSPARTAREQIKKGSIGGLSISFTHDGFEPLPNGGRKFTAVNVTEISICRKPVHAGARIHEVKSVPLSPEESMENEALSEVGNNADTATELKAFNDNLGKLTARLDKIEVRVNRPHIAADAPQNDNEEKKAFFNYLRTGRVEEKAITTAPTSAGVLAPSEFRANIIERLTQFSPVRSVATTISMNSALIEFPRLVTDVTVGEVTETGTRPESEPTFDQIEVKPFEMSVIVPVTRIMLEDSQINLEGYLRTYLAKRYGEKESGWFVIGNGTTQAEGVLTSTDVGNGVVSASATAITADELIDMFYSIPTAYAANSHWLMNRDTMAKIRKLKDADGSYLWQPSIAAGQPATILGRPVLEAPHMPNVAAGTTPIVFGDFASGYLIADRVDFEFDTDTKTAWNTGLVKLLTRRRVGGRVVLGEALKKFRMKAA